MSDDMKTPPHMFWRKTGKTTGRWYYRRRVPEDLIEAVGEAVIMQALGTSDADEAKRLYLVMEAKWDEVFRSARQGHPTGTEFDQLRRQRVSALNKAERDPDAYMNGAPTVEWRKDKDGRDMPVDLFDDPAGVALKDVFLATENRRLRVEMASLLQEAALGLVDARLVDAKVEARRALIAGRVPTSEPKPATGPKFSKVVEEYLAEHEKSVDPRTTIKKRRHAAMFIEVVKDRPIDGYSLEDGKKYLAHIKAIKGRGTNRTLAVDTMQQRLDHVGGVFVWARTMYGEGVKNPVEGFKIPKIKTKVTDRKRLPFSVDELNAIFRELKPGDFLYWPTMLALYAGLREGPIAQLAVEDVKTEDGIVYLDIHDMGENKAKNEASVYTLPVHEVLLKKGFMAFVEARKKGRLFPEVAVGVRTRKRGGNDAWGDKLGKRFRYFLTVTGLKNEKLVFHSMRHNFAQACREADIPADMRGWIQGRAEAGSSGGYRGEQIGPKVAVKKPYVDRVRYGIEIEGK
jgi:integrase